MGEQHLNPQQLDVVHTLDRDLLLVASAGTGKTNTLACRVAHILETAGEKIPRILCLTFTNKACREMKERIQDRVAGHAQAVDIYTFHSFCFSVLQRESRLGSHVPQDMMIFDEEDIDLIIKEIIQEWHENKEHTSLRIPNSSQELINWIQIMKERRLQYGFESQDRYQDWVQTNRQWAKSDPKQHAAFFANKKTFSGDQVESDLIPLLMAYTETLDRQQGYDFTDLVVETRRLFQNPDIRARWNQTYQFINVDEMQDTNRLEYDVVECLFPGNRVLLCGDYFQTIYEWRGSEPWEIREAYIQKYKPKQITFYTNYRSNATLFNVGYNVLTHFFPERVSAIYDEMPFSASNVTGLPVTLLRANNLVGQGKRIFEYIRRLPKENETIAVLCRSNKVAQDLSRTFAYENSQVPPQDQRQFLLVEEYKFFRRAEIKDVMAFLRLLINPRDTLSAERIIKRFVKGVGDQRLRELRSESAKLAGIGVTDFFDIRLFEEEPYATLGRGLDSGNVIVYDVEATGTNDFGKDEIIQIAAVRIDKNGQEIDRFERFITPTIPVGTSEAVHHFSDAYLKENGEPATVVLQDFLNYAKGSVIVGHNVNFDITILRQELDKHGLPMPQFEAVYDTLDIFRRFYPKLPNYKLATLSTTFPCVHPPTHNAWDDILATADLLVMAWREKIMPTIDQRRVYITKYKAYFSEIAAQMASLRRQVAVSPPTRILAYIMNDMGVKEKYRDVDNGAARVERLRQLYVIFQELEAEWTRLGIINPVGEGALQRIVRQSALAAGEGDPSLKQGNKIPIITVHQAKGCEFDHVIIADVTSDVFPFKWAVKEGRMEEEERLFYVAVTRAKMDLVVTCTRGRESAFLRAIPPTLLVEK